MTRTVLTVSPDDELETLVRIMRDRSVSCVVVVDAENRPVGIVSERDVVRLLLGLLGRPENTQVSVSDVMTDEVVCVPTDTPLLEATALARDRAFRRLPVIDRAGRLVGIVTQTDLLRGHVAAVEERHAELERAVAERTCDLQGALDSLRALSLEDALLGIGNRRAMEVDLTHTHQTAMRYERPYCIALFDVDYFKAYNDHYGHPAGDEVLRELTEVLRGAMRGADRLYRYGGEELLLLLPETALDGARRLAARMVETVAQRGMPHERSPLGMITVSCGVASNDDAYTWQAIVERADEALYVSKGAGKNQSAS